MLLHEGHTPFGFRLLRTLCSISGLWLPSDPSLGLKQTLSVPTGFRILEWVLLISKLLQAARTIVDLTHLDFDKDFLFVLINLSACFVVTHSAVRSLYLMVHRRRLVRLLARVQGVLETSQVMQRTLVRAVSRKCLLYMAAPILWLAIIQSSAVLITLNMMSIVTNPGRDLTSAERTVLSFVNATREEIEGDAMLGILKQFAQVGAFLELSTTDALFLTLLVLMSSQLRQLKTTLGPAITAAASVGPFKHQRVLRSSGGGFTDLQFWLRHQQNLAKEVTALNYLWGPCTAMIFACNTCTLCLIAFAAAKMSTIWTMEFLVIGYGFLNLLPLFLYCYTGHLLKQAGEGVSEAAHRGPWLGAPPDLVSGLQLLALDCRRSFVARGGPFFTLSLEFFASVVGAVLTYFIVLLQMKPAP